MPYADSGGGQFLRRVAFDRDAHDTGAVGGRSRTVNANDIDLARSFQESSCKLLIGCA